MIDECMPVEVGNLPRDPVCASKECLAGARAVYLGQMLYTEGRGHLKEGIEEPLAPKGRTVGSHFRSH